MFWGSRCVYIRKPSWWEGGGGRAEAAPAPAPGARQLTPSRCAEAPAWLPQPASNWASEARQCGPEPLRSRGPPSPWHRTEEGAALGGRPLEPARAQTGRRGRARSGPARERLAGGLGGPLRGTAPCQCFALSKEGEWGMSSEIWKCGLVLGPCGCYSARRTCNQS